MRRTIPSRSSLIAFEAAARHQSFTSAATELALSESAISRQVASLEDQLGVKLFNRVKQRVSLTAAGTLYSHQVSHLLDQMERDMLNIMAHGGPRAILELAILPTFCSQWLIPRLGQFYLDHPEITINLSARSVIFLFKDTPFDAAIHFGQPNWPGTLSDTLFGEEVVTVCSPEFLRDKHIKEPTDLLNHPLLHLMSRPNDWRDWFRYAGAKEVTAVQGARFEYFSLIIRAACFGLGTALIPRFLITEELQQRQLVIAYDLPRSSDNKYYLVYPNENQSNPTLQIFRGWLLDEVSHYQP